MWELYPQPSNIKPMTHDTWHMTHDRQPSPSLDVGAWTWPWQPGGLVAIHPQCPTPHTSNDHSQNCGTYSENLKRQMVQTCRYADCTWQITSYNSTMQAPFACWCKVQSSGRTDGSTMTCTGIICAMCNARVLIDMSWLADLQTIKNHEHSHWWIMNQLAAGSTHHQGPNWQNDTTITQTFHHPSTLHTSTLPQPSVTKGFKVIQVDVILTYQHGSCQTLWNLVIQNNKPHSWEVHCTRDSNGQLCGYVWQWWCCHGAAMESFAFTVKCQESNSQEILWVFQKWQRMVAGARGTCCTTQGPIANGNMEYVVCSDNAASVPLPITTRMPNVAERNVKQIKPATMVLWLCSVHVQSLLCNSSTLVMPSTMSPSSNISLASHL